jgi:DNA polymerase-3 subunit gamma/tau
MNEMAYLVLARKYRPLTFEDVVGQEHVTRTLTNALSGGRVAHAYLFAGARGVGKTTVARLLAMALNCRAEEPPRPCGRCASCLEISAGQAVDVYEIDGASNRGIDEIRELRETVRYLPTQGAYKVYIIDEVHMLTAQAFNALLKTLEEPPAHVIFIFATTEAHKVPATILSRCQRYDFKRIPLKEAVERLEEIAARESIEIGPGALRFIAREAEGSLRDALSLLDQAVAFAGTKISDQAVTEALGLIDRGLIVDTARALLGGDAGLALELADRAYAFGFDTQEFAARLLEYIRSLVVVKVTRRPELILDLLSDELEELRDLAAGASLETLNLFFDALLRGLADLHRLNQPRLGLESLLVRLAQTEPVTAIAELTARLDALLEAAGPSLKLLQAAGADVPEGGASPAPEGGTQAPSAVEANPAPETAPAREEARQEAASPARTWTGFLEAARPRITPLRMVILEKARCSSFGPERVVLEVTNKIEAGYLDQAGLMDLLADYLAARPRLEVRVSPAEPEPAVAGKAAGKPEDEEAVRRHPAVQSAERVLGARLKEFIPNA